MNARTFGPIPGSTILTGITGRKAIVMAANVRIATVAEGIFKAAKDTDSAVFMELARSESDLSGGYTGMTPQVFSEKMHAAAAAVGCDIWALHADHISIKKGDAAEIEGTKELIDAQVKAGYTSFAIDASHLFNFQGKNVREELAENIAITSDLARYIRQKMNGKEFGLEVEVGEIGRKDTGGLILTRPEEAVGFIKALNENDVYPHVIAIANGSSHGHAYDANGNVVEQLSIDINRTKGDRPGVAGQPPPCRHRPARHHRYPAGSHQPALPQGRHHQRKCRDLLAGCGVRDPENLRAFSLQEHRGLDP